MNTLFMIILDLLKVVGKTTHNPTKWWFFMVTNPMVESVQNQMNNKHKI